MRMYAVNDIIDTHPHHARPPKVEAIFSRFRHLVHVMRPTMIKYQHSSAPCRDLRLCISHTAILFIGLHQDELGSPTRGRKSISTVKSVQAIQRGIRDDQDEGVYSCGSAQPIAEPSPRGLRARTKCNLYFAAASWLYWNRHVSSVLKYISNIPTTLVSRRKLVDS